MTDSDAFRIISRDLAARLLLGVCIVAFFLLHGCATLIDEHKPAPKGWPILRVSDNIVSGWEVQKHCYGYLPLAQKLIGSFPMACAEIRFDLGTCNIWRAHDATADILEHEQMHCRGLSHPGDTWAEDAWQAYQAAVAAAAIANINR